MKTTGGRLPDWPVICASVACSESSWSGLLLTFVSITPPSTRVGSASPPCSSRPVAGRSIWQAHSTPPGREWPLPASSASRILAKALLACDGSEERGGWAWLLRRFERCLSHCKNAIYCIASPIRIARHLCCSVHKKGAGIALTSLAALRHNHLICLRLHGGKVFTQPMTPE